MIRIWFSTFVLLAGLGPLVAQELLQPLIVTASRSGEPASEAAFSTATMDAEFLREQARRTLPEALQYTPGVLVQKTAHGHGSPFIRGFTGRQNLLMVDGVRINNSTWRGGPVQYWSTVDPYAIDHIELVRSQGSVLYGSDAAGGTLNAFIKSSGFAEQSAGAPFHHGSAEYEYRSNGEGSHIGRIASAFGTGGRWGVHLGFTAKNYGDIEDQAVGRMNDTGYPERDLDLRLDGAVGVNSILTLVHQQVDQDDISRWHRTTSNSGWNHGGHVTAPGKWTANEFDQERSLTYLRYAGNNEAADAAVRHWSATISYQTSRDSEFQNRMPDSDSLRRSDIDLETTGVDLQMESRLGPGSLVYGIDHYRDEVESSGSRNNRAGTAPRQNLPVADDSAYRLTGLFAEYRWNATDALDITGGLRHSLAEAELGRFYDSADTLQPRRELDWNATVGSLRAVHKIDALWNAYGGVSQAFRAPNLNDLTGSVSSKSGGTSFGSANARPEEFLTTEAGIRRHSGAFTLEAAVFHTWVDNLITSVPFAPGSSDSITANAADGYVYGVELQSAWNITPQWMLSGFAAWQDGREESPSSVGGPIVEKPMTRLLPLTSSVALRWTHASQRFWVEGRLLGATEEDRFTEADRKADDQRLPTDGTPGYLVASLRSGWKATERLEFTLGLENLGDADYRIHGSGQNEPGFQAVVSAKATW